MIKARSRVSLREGRLLEFSPSALICCYHSKPVSCTRFATNHCYERFVACHALQLFPTPHENLHSMRRAWSIRMTCSNLPATTVYKFFVLGPCFLSLSHEKGLAYRYHSDAPTAKSCYLFSSPYSNPLLSRHLVCSLSDQYYRHRPIQPLM